MNPFFYAADLCELLNEIPPDSIVSRTFYENDEIKAILFGFAPGQELSEHTAARPAILHFLEGQADVTLGDEKKRAATGSWVYMQPHLSHSIVAQERLVMLLLLL